MSIATKLLELRKNKGLTQEDLASDLNISQSSISNYEHGTSKPDVETLKKYASYFQVALSEFFIDDNYTFYNYENKNKGDINNLVINQLSEQLLEQVNKRLLDKEVIITMQKETITVLSTTVKQLQEVISGLNNNL